MSLTTEKRKLLSGSLLNLFSSRINDYKTIVNEKDDVIDSYDTGDDATHRSLYEDPALFIYNALQEIPYLGNYTINTSNENYKYLSFSTINVGSKIWGGFSISRRDSDFVWSLLPDYNGGNRPQNIIGIETGLYKNLDFNCVDKGAGLTEPLVSSIDFSKAYGSQVAESDNGINFYRLYNAFTDLKNGFINGSSFIDYGIDYTSTAWPPLANGLIYIPAVTFSSTGKLSSNALTSTRTSSYSGTIGNTIPIGKYIVCSNSDGTEINIAKVYTKIETQTSSTTSGGGSGGSSSTTNYVWNYVISEIRTLSGVSGTSLTIDKKISSTDANKVFTELKRLYINELNSLKTTINNISKNYTEENSLKSNISSFLDYLNGLTISSATDVNNFYDRANSFNTLINNRINSLINVINSSTHLNDIKNIINLRINKTDGSLFEIFRRIEAMDSTYSKYVQGGSKIDFYTNKVLCAKVLEAPNNNYNITVAKTLNSAYGSTNFNVGDSFYILDDNKPEMKVTVLSVTYGKISDSENTNISSTDSASASTPTIDVKYLKTNKIISNDFSTSSNLRIAKDLI